MQAPTAKNYNNFRFSSVRLQCRPNAIAEANDNVVYHA
jgi:hypothetical protein